MARVVRSAERASGSTKCFGSTGDRCVHERHLRLQCSAMLTSQVRLSIRPSLSLYRSAMILSSRPVPQLPQRNPELPLYSGDLSLEMLSDECGVGGGRLRPAVP